MSEDGARAAHEQAVRAAALVRRIGPLLHGQGETVQSAVLADLLAMWLAGHVGPGAEVVRAQLLVAHIDLVWSLVPINAAAMLERLEAATAARH